MAGNCIGVTLNVPIFTGFDTTYRVRSAEAQADLRAAQRDRLRNQVALDVWKAYQSLTTATQSLKTTARSGGQRRAVGAFALGRYKAGVGTVLDLLTAQSALASARLQRIQAAARLARLPRHAGPGGRRARLHAAATGGGRKTMKRIGKIVIGCAWPPA
jgi:outer membrane protein TolC